MAGKSCSAEEKGDGGSSRDPRGGPNRDRRRRTKGGAVLTGTGVGGAVNAEESSAEADNQRQGEIHRETVTIAGRDSRASK